MEVEQRVVTEIALAAPGHLAAAKVPVRAVVAELRLLRQQLGVAKVVGIPPAQVCRA